MPVLMDGKRRRTRHVHGVYVEEHVINTLCKRMQGGQASRRIAIKDLEPLFGGEFKVCWCTQPSFWRVTCGKGVVGLLHYCQKGSDIWNKLLSLDH